MPKELPNDVKYITVKIPLFVGKLQRPTRFRADYTLKGREHSEVLDRVFLGFHNLDTENVSSYNRSFQLLLEAIREKFPSGVK